MEILVFSKTNFYFQKKESQFKQSHLTGNQNSCIMNSINIPKVKSIVAAILLFSQPFIGSGLAWAQVQPDYKISEIVMKGLCSAGVSARDTVDQSMSVFQHAVKKSIESSGLDQTSNKSYNQWWEKYYKDVVCEKEEERDMFGGLIQKAEKRNLLQHIVSEKTFENELMHYDDYFTGDMSLNINILGKDGETIVSWLDKKIAESSGIDKEYFEMTQKRFIENYNGKRTEELEKED